MKLFSRSPSKRRVIVKSGTIGIVLGLAMAFCTVKYNEPSPEHNYYGSYSKNVKSLEVRDNCRIKKFGVAPWRVGEKNAEWEQHTRLALVAMGLPVDAIDKAILKLRDKSDGAVGFGNKYGMPTNSKNYYLPAFETTYKKNNIYTVCHASSTDFKDNLQQEFATFYLVEHNGITYHIGEFLACGNVSRFFPAPNGWMPGNSNRGHIVGTVPEPSSFLLVVLGFLLMIFAGRKL